MGLDTEQKVRWALELKWSDRYFEYPLELKSVLHFCHSHNLMQVMITTISQQGAKDVKSVTLHFFPASIYAFAIGYNTMQGKEPPELFGDFRVT